MKRYGLGRVQGATQGSVGVSICERSDGEYLKRDDVIAALAENAHYEGDLEEMLERLGIASEEWHDALDGFNPGPEPDYDGSSVLDYSRGVR